MTPITDERTVRNLIHSDLVVASSVDSLAHGRGPTSGAVFDGLRR